MSGVNLVEVYATVTDRAGKPIRGLTARDFTVSEDGQPQVVTTFAAGDSPLSAAVAIDRSFSMGERIGVAKSAARAFIGALRPIDEVMVLAVGSEIETATALTTDHREALASIDRLDRWGTTPLYDATRDAIDAIGQAKGSRALIYPAAIGTTRPPVFAELAAATGGRSFHDQTPAGLNATMALVADELRFQYLLGYVPSPATAGEAASAKLEWRSIDVRANRADAVVRARDGYYAR